MLVCFTSKCCTCVYNLFGRLTDAPRPAVEAHSALADSTVGSIKREKEEENMEERGVRRQRKGKERMNLLHSEALSIYAIGV